jgi:hypothetical protein
MLPLFPRGVGVPGGRPVAVGRGICVEAGTGAVEVEVSSDVAGATGEFSGNWVGVEAGLVLLQAARETARERKKVAYFAVGDMVFLIHTHSVYQ